MIIVCVVSVHLGGLFYLSLGETVSHGIAVKRQPVAVRTVVAAAPTPILQAVPKPQVVAAPKPKVETKAKPAPKPKEKPAKPAPASNEQQQVLKRVQEQLTQLRATPAPKAAQEALAALPVLQIAPLQTKSVDVSYEEDLVTRLRTLLRLPEYGQVKVRLVVRRDGTISSVEILSAESAVNRSYVETHLPRCKLADFGRRFGEESERPFTVVLSNAF
jgi:outer membrane biosynthesis protein TonB